MNRRQFLFFVLGLGACHDDGRELMPAILPYFPPQPIMQTPFALPPATVGVVYSTTVVASGGVPPYTYAITGDAPDTGAWLSINPATGGLSGTPGTAETEAVTIVPTDSVGTVGVPRTFSLVVQSTSSPFALLTINLPPATQNIAYSQTLIAAGSGNFTWSLTSAITPAGTGLALSSAGVISGTPPNLVNTATTPTSITIPIKVVDNNTGNSTTHSYALSVMAQPALTYTAPTDTTLRVEPTTPAWGAFNSILNDDISGYRVLRVTDGVSIPQAPDAGGTVYVNDGSAEECKFSALGTYFEVSDGGGGNYFYQLNKATFQVTNLTVNGQIRGTGFLYWQWSPVLDTVIYGVPNATRNLIQTMDILSAVKTTVWDLTSFQTAYGNVEDVNVADNLNIVCRIGPQDTATGVAALVQGLQLFMDTNAGTVNGIALAGLPSPFGVHNIRVGQEGRYVKITKSGGGFVFWDAVANLIIGTLPAGQGHQAVQWGQYINNNPQDSIRDCTTAAGLANPKTIFTSPSYTLGPGAAPDAYASWCNQRANMQAPALFMSVGQSGLGLPVTQPYEQELYLATTNSPANAATVYRIAHHFSPFYGDFYDLVHATVSRDGRYVLFNSNYKGTIGSSTGSVTATVSNGSATLTAVSPNNGSTLPVGTPVSGTGIPANTVITGLNLSNSTRTMNNAATAPASSVTATSYRKDVFLIELK